MRIAPFSAIFALVIASVSGAGPWMARGTTLPPSTESTVSPSVAVLETSLATSKRPYPIKKTKPTDLPTPSVAALDTTSAATILPSSTGAPMDLSSITPVAIESTAASISTILELGSTSTVRLETDASSLPSSEAPLSPSSEAPLASTSEEPLNPTSERLSTPSSEAPIIESTTVSPSDVTELETSSVAPGGESTPIPVETKETKPPKPLKTVPTLPPVDFDCSKKADGYYPDEKDKCSGTYYACIGGLARRLDCAAGLVFEPDTVTCERRHESFRCTGTRRTTMPSTPRRPPPPPTKLIIDCTKLDDGWYVDPLKKCSHTFYSCSNGIGSRFDCPGNMYYDIESKSCQAFLDVFACAGKRRPTTKNIQTTTVPGVTEKLPIDCADKASGQYPDPTKKCSQIYYVCSNRDGFKRSCPDGLYYDAKKQLCDYKEEIFACVGRKPVTKATKKPAPPVPSPASLPSTEYKCGGKADGSYLPAGKKCSEIYFRCVGGVAYKLKCPEGLYYDIENDLCDRWINLFVCSGKKPASTLPTTTTKPKPTEKLPIDCSDKKDGDYPDPEKKCSSVYYTCSNYIGSRRLCADSAAFDKELGLCDHKEIVPDCTGKPRPLTTTSSTVIPKVTPKLPYNCEKRGDGNYAAGKCIDYYWSCVGGSTIYASCPPNTYYDSEMDECGYRHEIPACGGVRPTTQKP